MKRVCQEITDYVRSCEHLLSNHATLTKDERDLLEYYVKELSREYLSGKPTLRQGYNETVEAKDNSATG